MPISGLRDRVRTQLVEFTWSQWAHLGLSSHRTRVDHWAIDPEALILFTLDVSRRDPRLFDELLDWMCLNAKLLSVQRLRNLTSRFPLEPNLVDAVMEWVVEAASGVRWRMRTPRPRRRGKPLPVFSQDVIAFVGKADPIFERYGFSRPRAVRSGKSNEPDIRHMVNIAFRLRHFFGIGTRAEVMRILLTFIEGSLDAARIADESGFAKRNINDALAGLVASGSVKARWSRNKRVFSIDRNKWASVLEIPPKAGPLPIFVSWMHVFPVLLVVLHWLEQDKAGESEYMASSRARDLVDRLQKDVERLDLPLPSGGDQTGVAYIRRFEDFVESLLGLIDDRT